MTLTFHHITPHHTHAFFSPRPTPTPNPKHAHRRREDAAEQREAATSAEDLNQDVVGGRIPRTLLKLLTYCRVSDKATCEVLLELGKVKVNGEVCDDPVRLVSRLVEPRQSRRVRLDRVGLFVGCRLSVGVGG
jgi:hypothetical protein